GRVAGTVVGPQERNSPVRIDGVGKRRRTLREPERDPRIPRQRLNIGRRDVLLNGDAAARALQIRRHDAEAPAENKLWTEGPGKRSRVSTIAATTTRDSA